MYNNKYAIVIILSVFLVFCSSFAGQAEEYDKVVNGQEVSIQLDVSDSLSGVYDYKYALNDDNWTDWIVTGDNTTSFSVDITLEKEGANSLSIIIRDKAGNESDEKNLDFYWITPPDLVKPADNKLVESNNVTFSWENKNADDYVLSVSGDEYETSNNSMSVSLGDGIHEWKVRARKNGVESNWSEERIIRISSNPPSADIIQPQEGEEVNNWATIEADVDWVEDFGLKNAVLYVDGNVIENVSQGAPPMIISESVNLDSGNHTAKVRIEDSYGRVSTDSVDFTVSEDVPAPNLLYPNNGQVLNPEDMYLAWSHMENPRIQKDYHLTETSTSTLASEDKKGVINGSKTEAPSSVWYNNSLWSPIIGMNSSLELAKDEQFNNIVDSFEGKPGIFAESINDKLMGLGFSHIPSGDLDDGTYYWRVKFTNGNDSSYSQTYHFTIDSEKPPVPHPMQPSGFTSNDSPVFKWSDEGVDYDLVLKREKLVSQEEKNTIIDDNTVVKSKNNINNNNYNLEDSLKEGKYVWQVRSVEDGERSSWSNLESFWVDQSAPNVNIGYPNEDGPTGSYSILISLVDVTKLNADSINVKFDGEDLPNNKIYFSFVNNSTPSMVSVQAVVENVSEGEHTIRASVEDVLGHKGVGNHTYNATENYDGRVTTSEGVLPASAGGDGDDGPPVIYSGVTDFNPFSDALDFMVKTGENEYKTGNDIDTSVVVVNGTSSILVGNYDLELENASSKSLQMSTFPHSVSQRDSIIKAPLSPGDAPIELYNGGSNNLLALKAVSIIAGLGWRFWLIIIAIISIIGIIIGYYLFQKKIKPREVEDDEIETDDDRI